MFKAISNLFNKESVERTEPSFQDEKKPALEALRPRALELMRILIRQGFEGDNQNLIGMVFSLVSAEAEGRIDGDKDARTNAIIAGVHKLAIDNPEWLTLEQRHKAFDQMVKLQAELEQQSGTPLPADMKAEMLAKAKHKFGI